VKIACFFKEHIMKRLLVFIILAFAANAFAQGMSDFEAYKNQQNAQFQKYNSGGSYYSDPIDTKPIDPAKTPQTGGIKDFKSYKAAFDSHIELLEDQFTLVTVAGFNPEQYTKQVADFDMGAFNAYFVQITRTGDVYNISYRVTYNDDYKVLRAWQEPRFKAKLNANEQKLYNEAMRLVSNQINKAATDFDKLLLIHDYLVSKVSYDERVVGSGGRINKNANPNAFTAYGALLEGKAVCEGYSKSIYLLANMAGVKAMKVNGDANRVPHSWNKALVAGSWYNIDATFDDPIGSPAAMIYYDYFNITENMLARDHTWDRNKYPAATATTDNYFVHNKLVAASVQDFGNLLKAGIQSSRNKAVSVYLTNYDRESYLAVVASLGLKNPKFAAPTGKSGVFVLMYD
jgi:transglutaminase-like putative cysteine protease